MHLENYQKLSSFSNQFCYLKEYFKNYHLPGRSQLLDELQDHLINFIKVTKITNSEEAYQFYHFLLEHYFLRNSLKNSLSTILSTSIIDSNSLFKILELFHPSEILEDDHYQYRLLHFVIKSYNVANLKIIKNFMRTEYHNMLFLLQMEYHIQRILDDDVKNYFDFIRLLLNDLTKQNSFTIQYYGSGGYKNVFIIDNYVLQIGEGPHINNFPKTSSICAPILFKLFGPLQISISPLLSHETNFDECAEAFIKARLDHVLLLDAKKENFGKYKEDFIHPYKNISLLGKQFLGIDYFDLSDTKRGEVKYLDIDYYIDTTINNKENKKLENVFYFQYQRYEKEYQKIYKKL